MKRSLIACAFVLLVGADGAKAHVIFETKQTRAGSSYKAELGVMHGCKGSPTIAVDLTLPEGVIDVKPYAKPGWTITTKRGAYAKAYPSMHGVAKEGVREIKWSGGSLPDDFVDDFDFRAQIAADVAPGPLYFPVTQSCAQGEHRWAEVPDAALPGVNFEHPAPALLILAADDPQIVTAGPIHVENAFTRPTLGGATVAVGYMTIVNTGKGDDKLLSVTSDISATSEIHESKIVGGVMEMDELPNGLAIPAGGTIALKPGSYHVMFVGLRHAVKAGETIHATLTFEKAGKAAVSFMGAQSPGAMSPSDSMGGMKMP